MSQRVPIAALIACAALLVGTPAAATWPTDPAVNLPVCTVAGEQTTPAILPDGQGGAYVLWRDRRGATIYDVYAQHLTAEGERLWAADGAAIEVWANDVDDFVAIPNGSGGFFLACFDGSLIRLEHNGYDPTRPTSLPRRALVTTVPGWAFGIAANGMREVILAWIQDGDPFDSLRVDRYVPDPDDPERSWLRAFRTALALSEIRAERVQIADDGLGGAWVVLADETFSDDRFGLHLFRYRASGQRLDAGTLPWTGERSRLDQYREALLATPDGGVLAVWSGSSDPATHPSFNTNDVFVAHFDSACAMTDLAVIANEDDMLGSPDACLDGGGGIIASWPNQASRELRARRMSLHAVPMWPIPGVLVSATSETASPLGPPEMVPTCDGGAVVLWRDLEDDIRAQRVSQDGWLEWPAPVALCTAAGDRRAPVAIADGAGGAFVAWHDLRNADGGDIYAQRIRGHGRLGAGATITGVDDLPGDQGGRVRIAWNASPLDLATDLGISAYGIWRRLDAGAATAAIAAGRRVLSAAPCAEDARPGVLRTLGTGAAATFWEGVGMTLARGQTAYSFVATTLADSTPGVIPWEVFMVDAHERDHPVIWDSAPDSGYSVDNLAPPATAALAGTYEDGATSLHWRPIPVTDLVLYRVYRGDSLDFTTDPAHRIAETADTACVDAPGGPRYYKVTGLDTHGNEGPPATFDPGIPVGAPGPVVASGFRLAPPSPNPATGAVGVNFVLPRESAVDLAVHDVSGRRVRTLATGRLAAGEHARTWDGRDEGGHALGAGLYLVCLRSDGWSTSRKLVRLR